VFFTNERHFPLGANGMELDGADLAILRAVQEDSRRSLRELAKLAGVSAPTAAAKLKALAAKGALKGFSAQLSPEALGEHVMLLEVKARPSEVEAVAERLGALPEVRVCHIASPHRVLAFATLLDGGLEAEFHEKVGRIEPIVSYESFVIRKTVKDLPLAVVDRGVMLTVKCEFCGRRTKDEALRVKVGEITHFVCCESCKAGFEERAGRLAKMVGKGRKAGAAQALKERPRSGAEAHHH